MFDNLHINPEFLHAVKGLSNMFGAPKADVVPEGQAGLSPEAQALFDVKKNILAEVRANLPEGERPTLEQYRLASEAFAQTEKGAAMAARGEWNNRIAADLSGQDLSGFTITEPKKLGVAETHHLDQQASEWQRSRAADTIDIHDRDGDGQINSAPVHQFYDNVSFDKADLHGAWVEPATSFNEEIAKAGNLKELTFSGMHEGDEFTFGAGQYEKATLRDVQGGRVIFGENTQVDIIHLEGKSCHVEMRDNAYVSNITTVENFRVLDLQMGKNAILANSNLDNCTIAMSSHFEPGATFRNVNLSGNVEGLDFSGLKLHNVTIDGKPVTDTAMLEEHGIQHSGATSITSTVAAKALSTQLAEANPNDTVTALGRAQEVLDVSQHNNGNDPIAAARAAMLAAGVVGGESVSNKDISLTTQVASQERTVPVEHQANGANMQRVATQQG